MDSRITFLVETIQDFISLGRTIEAAQFHLKKGGFDDAMIAEAISEFNKSLSHSRDTTVLREKNSAQSDWYGVPLSAPDSHWQLLREHLINHRNWTDEMLQSLDTESTIVVSNLAPPMAGSAKVVKGLVLGYVQSGKTTNFSGVIAKSLDAGYQLIIVLAGLHNNLRLQTERRLFREICEPKLQACTNLTAVDENGDFKRTQTQRAERACGRSDGFSIAVIKKNATVLRNFDSWLSDAMPETLQRCPTLIIDDESDHASVNTAKPEEDPTAINNLIRKIIGHFSTLSYVGYTATPFANVLIDASIDDDLYPRDFLISLEKPASYFGAEELFGSKALLDSGNGNGLPVIRTVPNSELSGIVGTRKSSGNIVREIPQSLIDALASFILAGSIRLARQQHNEHVMMLVHTSHLTSIQEELFNKISLFIEELKASSSEILTEEFRSRLITLYQRDFSVVSNQFRAVKSFPIDTLLRNAHRFVSRIEVTLDNSTSDERLSFDRDTPLWGIVIGGNTLSRGLTIEGLTTSYYVRDAKGYDTLLQMGRWFGYRPNYVDVTRIYMTDPLQKKFFHLSCVEEEIRAEIKTLAENKERPIDVAMRIRCHPSMVVTSNLKMQSGRDTFLTFSATKLQARHLNIEDKDLLRRNLLAVEHLISGIEKCGVCPTPSTFADFSGCLLYRKVAPELILQFLDGYGFSSANVKFSNSMLSQYIQDLARQGELGSWSVAIIGSKEGDPIGLPNGHSVNRVERSVLGTRLSDRDMTAVYLSALSPPEDELIDLDDLAAASAKTVVEFRTQKDGSKKSCSAIRQELRPNSRGLVLLYPLDVSGRRTAKPSESDESEIDTLPITGKLLPLRADIDIFGITFVFPKSQKDTGRYRYIVNGTV